MRQLRGEDARFVYAESGHAHPNITLISVYNPVSELEGRPRFEALLRHVGNRLHLSPIFRNKLLRVPLELDFPYWIGDEHFDLEYHVRHVALPKPGDWHQFCIQASRIHARALDLTKPLWELYLVEGLDSLQDLPKNSFALLVKIHHAAIDVHGGSDIMTLLHDTTPQPPTQEPVEPWFPESPPGSIVLLSRAVLNNVVHPLVFAGPLMRSLGNLTPTMWGLLGDVWLGKSRMPITRFNAEVSPHRVFESRRFTIEQFKQIRALVPGATINDAVLAVCGGALRRYLQAHEELPIAGLVGLAPITVHTTLEQIANTPSSSELSMMRVPLGTELENPLERLREIHRHTSEKAEAGHAVAAKDLTDISKHAPAATLALSAKLVASSALESGQYEPLAGCSIMNVPGPTIPLYLDGARMTYFSAIMPIADGMGLVFAVTSYDGKVLVSITSCREMMPDPGFFAHCIRESFQELLAIAERRKKKGPLPRKRGRGVR
jgi:WS/DGAT/MGAT family acyltransferase